MHTALLPLLWFAPAALADVGADVALVRDALSPRHPTASCDALVARLVAPSAALVAVADAPAGPPWLAVRAAACLSALPADPSDAVAADARVRWLKDPTALGLARTVIAALPRLHAAEVRHLAELTLQGPHAPHLYDALLASPAPAAVDVARAHVAP
jgi:hypothetical protein